MTRIFFQPENISYLTYDPHGIISFVYMFPLGIVLFTLCMCIYCKTLLDCTLPGKYYVLLCTTIKVYKIGAKNLAAKLKFVSTRSSGSYNNYIY